MSKNSAEAESRRIVAGSPPPAERHGQHTKIGVTHVGGTLQLAGKRVRVASVLLPGLPLGSDVILLLKRGDNSKYAIVEGGYAYLNGAQA